MYVRFDDWEFDDDNHVHAHSPSCAYNVHGKLEVGLVHYSLVMASFRIAESVNPQIVIAWKSSCTLMTADRSMSFNYLLDTV